MYMLSLKNKDDYWTCFTLSSHTQEPDISTPMAIKWEKIGQLLTSYIFQHSFNNQFSPLDNPAHCVWQYKSARLYLQFLNPVQSHSV